MLAQVTLRNNDAITAPAGWTTTGNLRTSGATLEQRIYYRIATAADTAGTTYQWSWTTQLGRRGGHPRLLRNGCDEPDRRGGDRQRRQRDDGDGHRADDHAGRTT